MTQNQAAERECTQQQDTTCTHWTEAVEGRIKRRLTVLSVCQFVLAIFAPLALIYGLFLSTTDPIQSILASTGIQEYLEIGAAGVVIAFTVFLLKFWKNIATALLKKEETLIVLQVYGEMIRSNIAVEDILPRYLDAISGLQEAVSVPKIVAERKSENE